VFSKNAFAKLAKTLLAEPISHTTRSPDPQSLLAVSGAHPQFYSRKLCPKCEMLRVTAATEMRGQARRAHQKSPTDRLFSIAGDEIWRNREATLCWSLAKYQSAQDRVRRTT